MNSKTAAARNWNSWLQPHRTTAPPKPQRIIGFVARPPAEWPEDKARIHVTVERSLLMMPGLRHLSVLPAECMIPVLEVAPSAH